jgi:glycosyltransferase involved in cell wall biosynthesis
MSAHKAPLRVALVAGTLAQSGAEKQFVYMAEALRQAAVDVRVFTLGHAEHFEARLHKRGIPLEWIGTPPGKGRRLVRLIRAWRRFRPHIAQAGHFYTNLYVTLAARCSGAVALGAIRSDTRFDVRSMGAMGRPSLRLPPSLLANSYAARTNAEQYFGVPSGRIYVLPNVIDPAEMVNDLPASSQGTTGPPVVALAARLVPAKRIDRFLTALALARVEVPNLRGLVVGDGAERPRLLAQAQGLGLDAPALEFRPATRELGALLRGVSMLALTSDHEGFPNVILEAMVAGVPVVTTPAGDAAGVVIDGVTGYVVPFDETATLAARFVRLAQSAEVRLEFGRNGASRARDHYSTRGLADRLLAIHGAIAQQQDRSDLIEIIQRHVTDDHGETTT